MPASPNRELLFAGGSVALDADLRRRVRPEEAGWPSPSREHCGVLRNFRTDQAADQAPKPNPRKPNRRPSLRRCGQLDQGARSSQAAWSSEHTALHQGVPSGAAERISPLQEWPVLRQRVAAPENY